VSEANRAGQNMGEQGKTEGFSFSDPANRLSRVIFFSSLRMKWSSGKLRQKSFFAYKGQEALVELLFFWFFIKKALF
jgi:hypothetical protein